MKILFDLLHPADVNLFKNSVYTLSQQGHSIFLAYRQRGVLDIIARSEFPEIDLTRLGIHRKSRLGKLYSIIQKEILTFKFLRKNKIKLVVCQGLACGIACKLLGVKILHYDDDSEYRLTFLLGKLFSDIDVMPDFIPVSGKNIYKYKGFKELAYLHPDYFTPFEEIIAEYGLQPYNYVFIREISNVTLNYLNPRRLLPEIVDYLKKYNIKILLSIEDKMLVDDYSESCIIMKEPIKHLFSLIYFSRFVISSGDTMARESCLLGNPCIYTGGRIMSANKKLIDIGVMVKTDEIALVFKTIDEMMDISFIQKTKVKMSDLIANEFEDTNEVILCQIKKLLGLQSNIS
jgi:predicted glycosyltransferase